MRLLLLCAAAVCLTAPYTRGQTPPPLRVMPLGDSITYGAHHTSTPDDGGYRYPLYVALTNVGYNIDYIGTQTSIPAAGLGTEINHEGHSGWRISTTANNGLYEYILGWLAQVEDPDVVLVHIGTNDTNDPDFAHAIDELDALITRIATARPYTHIVVTTLMKRGASDADANYVAIANSFNPFVESRILAQQALGRRVHFLDMHAYLERSDMYDNLHPSPSGYAKMAAAWYPAVTNIVGPYGDRLPPGLSSVKAVSTTNLTVTFSKPLDLAASPAATNPASYAVSPAGSVTAVSSLSADLRKITLTVAGVSASTLSTLSFNGAITDLVPAAEGGPFTANLNESRTFAALAASGLAVDNVPANILEGWEPLYTLNIPTTTRYGRDPVGYTLNSAAAYANLPLSRVAYYMALQRLDEPLYYVWAETDAFTQDAAKLGVPTTVSGAFFQQSVSNLTVFSSSPNVTPGQFAIGNIEFWPCNYTYANGAAVSGASSITYDFGDTTSNGDYGSMQIHNTALGETLLSFSHWGSATTTTYIPCLGIGNNPSASATSAGVQSDWTFTENAGQITTRVLQVFVKRAAAPVPHALPAPLAAFAGYDGTHLSVSFSSPLLAASVTAAAFTLDNGVTVTGAKLFKDLKTVTLTTTPQPAGAVLTLTVSGVRDLQTAAAAPATSLSVAALPAQIAEDAGTVAAGYRVVYVLDIPVTSDFGNALPDPYLFNAAAANPTSFDRVAYYLELGQRPLVAPARQFAWTSMDAFTPYLSKIGIPNTATKAVFVQIVTNLTVKSNKSGVSNGDFDTGNIEFWPSNYSEGNTKGIPGASSSTFDFGDGGYSAAAGHGSFQVHNYLSAQTVFSVSRWGANSTTPIGIGIGNCPSSETTSTADRDWTHASNAAFYSYRRLYVLARPKPADPAPLMPPAEVVACVPDAANYQHLYTIDIPLQPKFADAALRPSYYTVDNSGRFANLPHSRVAYFLELVKNNATSYCWTAFNALSAGVNRLGVPANDAFFWQSVTNLDVLSNVPGIVNTNGCETGNIEFWDWDYTATNEHAIAGASNTAYDFGDRRSTSRGGSYGSMQVHNYGAGQTLWALSRFGACGGTDKVNVGIGSNPSGEPDWTHTGSGVNWDSRRLLVFVKPVPQTPEIPPEVLANVPDAANFKHLYTVNIPARARFDLDASNALYYAVNNTNALNGAIGRVGYYFELVAGGVTSFCWTAFDTFTQDATQLGVPRKDKIYQQFVSNLDVLSNVAGVITTNGCSTGNIEFWDWDYGASGNQGIPGGSNSACDFADSRNSAAGGRYGSMQVHNWGARQTLWALNRFNSSTENTCVGIGNNPSGSHTDYTFLLNGNLYESRRLLVFVQPAGGPDAVALDMTRPAPSRALGQTSLNRALVVFNKPVADSAASPTNFSANNGLAILAAAMHPVYSNTCVILTTSPQTSGTAYTLTVSNVRDRSPSPNVMWPNQTVAFTAQNEASARPDFLPSVPEASDYRLVQKLALNRQTYWSKGATFSLDDTWPEAPQFDRVAYALDLLGTNGVRQWVWVSLEPFTTDPLRVGLPTGDRAARFQQAVSNLTVAVSSSVTNVTSGAFADGNIEFWPNNYSAVNEAAILGASGSAYDFGDRVDPTVPVGHGSFQVHNFRLGQTLFAVNSWGSDNRAVEMGIGNRPSGAPDYTGTGDYSQYASRTLYVFVRPSAVMLSEPAPVPGWGTVPLIGLSPADQLVDVGTPAVFTVLANGAERYQWRKSGVFIPGATSAILMVPEVHGRDIGSYDVLVYGSGSKYAVSLPAQLAITANGSILLLK